MAFRIHGLRVAAFATFVAFTGLIATVAPVAATDPVPTDSPAPSAAPTADPTPALIETPAPAVEPTAPVTDPAPSTVPLAVAAAPRVIRPNRALRVVRIALAQRGDRYRRGATGPSAFDCSGLVRYAYRKAGMSGRLGGGHSARAMYQWARRDHRLSRSNPHIGDVVIYGHGSHVGIYIGRGRVISALNPRQGIRITRLHALGAPFTAFIHTRLPTGG